MSLPSNVHVSQHPVLRAKLSQLRSKSTTERQVKEIIHDISLIVACEALRQSIKAVDGPKDETPLGFQYTTTTIEPSSVCIVPILRSGLAMVDALQTMLPISVPVYHLGLYREPSTLEPVEYYNNLPQSRPSSTSSSAVPSLAIIVDPIIATGGTCSAAINTLREWGVQRVLVMSMVGAVPGINRAAQEWPEGTDIWIAGVDDNLTANGMLNPGVGDIGDRLFSTIGK